MKPPKNQSVAPSPAGLLKLAKENPWWQFNTEELALICNVSERTLTEVRKEPDSPFSAGKCRPETLAEWLKNHAGWQPSK